LNGDRWQEGMGFKSLRYRPNIDVAELMVQFTLPKNSKITAGKTWARLAGGRNPREYRVYRWNPDDGKNPRMDTYSSLRLRADGARRADLD
jgi:hypothetical protein